MIYLKRKIKETSEEISSIETRLFATKNKEKTIYLSEKLSSLRILLKGLEDNI